jgi:hypothetical protein
MQTGCVDYIYGWFFYRSLSGDVTGRYRLLRR